jgi:PBP1b-binding outer membrane lipoprotein LpoB
MIKKTLLMVIVIIVLAISGCTENDIQTVNNTTDAPANTTNATANASEQEYAESQSVSIPLERPPFIEDQ